MGLELAVKLHIEMMDDVISLCLIYVCLSVVLRVLCYNSNTMKITGFE